MTRKTRYYCVDCHGACSRGCARCKRCAAKQRAVNEGRVLVVGVSRDEDYRPTAAELRRVARQLARLEARRRVTPRRLTAEDIWSRCPLPADEEYAAFDGVRR